MKIILDGTLKDMKTLETIIADLKTLLMHISGDIEVTLDFSITNTKP